jgi:uncharacterized membrane protein YiaA
MKTGFGVFVIGLLLIMVGWMDVDFNYVSMVIMGMGLFLAYVGVKLMKGRGSLVDNPTLW